MIFVLLALITVSGIVGAVAFLRSGASNAHRQENELRAEDFEIIDTTPITNERE
ncbi:MAG TPA: hypothetical protein VJH63_00140 [Candidatus Paceibacterota bacterium]